MGELIVLPRAERASQVPQSLDHSAEILFFTGVRYYRMTDDETQKAELHQRKAHQVKVRRRRSVSPKALREMRVDGHA